MGSASIIAYNVSKHSIEAFLKDALCCADKHQLSASYPNHNALVTSQLWEQTASVDIGALNLSKNISVGQGLQDNAPNVPHLKNSGKGTSLA